MEDLLNAAENYLDHLCVNILDRSVGSAGNREATKYFLEEISRHGWRAQSDAFKAIDWREEGVELTVGDERFNAFVSPYSLGCHLESELVTAAAVDEIRRNDIRGKIIIMYGELAAEQLMPKNFKFYNPESHQAIISALEEEQPDGIICVTGRNASLAGGVYPFPLIEDGDFDIPSVYMTDEEGEKLLKHSNQTARLIARSERIEDKAFNVVARLGNPHGKRVVITAHIDAKKGTPGAIDNATGVVVLLLAARLLAEYQGNRLIEIVAFNGEDYYSVPGQMLYIEQNNSNFQNILLNINIDGAGYKDGLSAISFYELPDELKRSFDRVLKEHQGMTEGKAWPQGDHSIFLQMGCPAVALTSNWFSNNINSQTITHTPKDNRSIVDCAKLVEISRFLAEVIPII